MTDTPTCLTRARIEAPEPTASRIAAALEEALDPEALSISIFELNETLFEVSALYETPPDRAALHDLITAVSDRARAATLSIEPLPEADWVTISQGQRGPVRAGRFLIHGSHDRDHVLRNRYTFEIDADQAFGTAHHATTRACLIVLDRFAKHSRPDLVLDLGTGTGILAIAASLAFDRPVVATDNDPVAVRIAKDNARKAGLRRQIHVLAAEGLEDPVLRRLKPDLIVANILAGPLYLLGPSIARCLAPGGHVLLSGITEAQSPATTARYCSFGFALEQRIVSDGWAALLLRHQKSNAKLD